MPNSGGGHIGLTLRHMPCVRSCVRCPFITLYSTVYVSTTSPIAFKIWVETSLATRPIYKYVTFFFYFFFFFHLHSTF